MLLKIPVTERKTNRSILDETKPETSLESTIVKHARTFLGHTKLTCGMEKEVILRNNWGVII